MSLTKKSNAVPLNQCPICKSKVPKRSLNASSAASKLCKIYEQIVRSYSEMNGGDEDWIHESGIRGNDAYYTGGGVPLDNLSQLYPYPEKANEKSQSKLGKISEIECESDSSDLFENFNDNENEIDRDCDLETQLDDYETSRIYDETSQLTNSKTKTAKATTTPSESEIKREYPPSLPSSPLIYAQTEETQLLTCDKLLNINTQELEKLSAINDSIDKELAELEKKLAAASKPETKNDDAVNEKENNITTNLVIEDERKVGRLKVYSSSKSKLNLSKKGKLAGGPVAEEECERIDPLKLNSITTTGIKDEESLLQLTKFSDKFNCKIFSDFQFASTLIIPTNPKNLIVKRRTMKYFEALILGKEIFSFDWVSACLKANKMISPLDFKIKGDEIGLGSGRSRNRNRNRKGSNCFGNGDF